MHKPSNPLSSRAIHADEEYQYINDLTENSGLDDEDEEFVFTSSSSGMKPRSLNDSKRKPPVYTESSEVKEYMTLVAQSNITRRWQWGFCCTTTFTVALIAACIAFMTYNLFFTAPFLYIEQIQLSNVPNILRNDTMVGFRVILRGLNNNFAELTLQDIKLYATIRDAGTPSGVGYQLETPIEKKYNASSNDLILKKRITTKLTIDASINLLPSPNYKQIEQLISNSQFSTYFVEFRFEGTAITSIGPLKHYHKLTKRQQPYLKIKVK